MEKNNSLRSSNKSSRSQQIYILSTRQTSSTLSNIWETITNYFKSDEIVEPKVQEPHDTIRLQLCKCPKTKNRDYCDNIHQILQMTKYANNNKRSYELYINLLAVKDKSLDINGENLRQIRKDTTRTYPSTVTFIQKDRILNKLENVLSAFSNYDNTIKYCQGMNFSVGFFLYHCQEHIAFWLFVSLIEEYNLRSVFMENFPGLKLHVKRVETILQNEYPFYWENFEKLGVKVEIFLVEWLFSLFSSLIPLELQMDFYKGFFSEGWIFFYKMCISSILNLKGKFSEADEIYIGLKIGKNEENIKEEDVKNSWKKIIQKAYIIKIKTDVMNINSS
jgi:CDGSH-type Zn-finger protein